jgi:hypothetical protein
MFKILQVIFLLSIQYNSFSLNAAPEFTAVFDGRKNAVIIRGQNTSPGLKTFIIQRSLDNNSWSDIGLQAVDPNAAIKPFYFEDKKPPVGENYYRLKCISINGKTEYSLSIMVIIASPLTSWIMYPVPVKDLLTLEYRGAEPIKGVINVFIQQSSGRILTRLRNSSLNTKIQIPVDNLGRGIYDIRIVVQGDVVWNQRFIK